MPRMAPRAGRLDDAVGRGPGRCSGSHGREGRQRVLRPGERRQPGRGHRPDERAWQPNPCALPHARRRRQAPLGSVRRSARRRLQAKESRRRRRPLPSVRRRDPNVRVHAVNLLGPRYLRGRRRLPGHEVLDEWPGALRPRRRCARRRLCCAAWATIPCELHVAWGWPGVLRPWSRRLRFLVHGARVRPGAVHPRYRRRRRPRGIGWLSPLARRALRRRARRRVRARRRRERRVGTSHSSQRWSDRGSVQPQRKHMLRHGAARAVLSGIRRRIHLLLGSGALDHDRRSARPAWHHGERARPPRSSGRSTAERPRRAPSRPALGPRHPRRVGGRLARRCPTAAFSTRRA
jgi:hypothetical protein